jgi:hypothetical protein
MQHVYCNSTEHINIMLLRKITTTLQHYNNTDQHRIQYKGDFESQHNTTAAHHQWSNTKQQHYSTEYQHLRWAEAENVLLPASTHISAAHSITEWACITTAHRCCTAQTNRVIALQSRRIQELPHIPTLYIMLASTQLTLSYFFSISKEINEPTFRLEDSLLICVGTTWRTDFVQKFIRYLRYNPNVATKSGGTGTESIATLPPFGPIEGNKWFDQISSQWESQKNRFVFISFGKIQFLPPCIWNLPFVSYRLWVHSME